MTPSLYSREDLLAHHPYASPHEVAGYRLHGGLDAAGAYVPPRTLHRLPAVREWQRRLAERGWPLVEADEEARRLTAGRLASAA